MRLNKISNEEVDVTLTADELMILNNVMYAYEQQYKADEDNVIIGDRFHELAAQLIIGRDICRYGHLDGHSLDTIIKHRMSMSNPGIESLEHK